MVTCHCGTSTALWGFLFYWEGVEQPVLSQQSPISGEGLPTALPVLHSVLLCLWGVHRVELDAMQCFFTTSMPGICLVLRDGALGHLGPRLAHIDSTVQIFLGWYRKANGEGTKLWRNYPSPMRPRTKLPTPPSFWILRTKISSHHLHECDFASPLL